MTYAQLDDRFDDHPKYEELGFKLAHFGLQACAITYCNRQLTDGRLPKSWIKKRFGRDGLRVAGQLVTWGIWTEDDRSFQVVGFLDHNPSRAVIESRRAAAKARKDAWKSKATGTGKAPGTSADDSNGTRSLPLPGTLFGTRSGTPPERVPERVRNKSSRAHARGRDPLHSDPLHSDPTKDPSGAVAPTGDHQRVIACYAAEYERVKRAKPGINGRTGKAAKDLLALFSADDACAVIRGAFADEFFTKARCELWDIAASPNRFPRINPPKPPVALVPTRAEDRVPPEIVAKALADFDAAGATGFEDPEPRRAGP